MKTVAGYVRDYVREQWHPGYFALVGLFLGISFFVNFTYHFESSIKRTLETPGEQVVFYFVFYSLPFFCTVLARAVTQRSYAVFADRYFWFLALFCLGILAIYVTLHNIPWYLLNHHPSVYGGFSAYLPMIVVRSISNALPALVMSLPLLGYWHVVDRSSMRVYGFDARSIDLKPYLLILGLLLPLIVAASCGSDFQQQYPRYRIGLSGGGWTGTQAVFVGLFEFCYGIDFIFVEFFFRGFMILALSRVLGKNAIMPMVVVYSFIHFEKPLLEAISSIVGGFVLGVITERTRSTYGGIILHVGIAYLMEIAGTIQHLLPQ